MDARGLAEVLAQALAERAPKGELLREVRQFIMDADRCVDPTSLLADAPLSTGDARWDALLAGVVEDIALRHGVTAPVWAVTAEPLHQWWFVTDFVQLHPTAFVETPPAVARHGVFIRRASLVNV